jgi:hypothetical protein
MLGLLIGLGLSSASCLQVLAKDHLVKDYLALSLLTLVFRAYLADQQIDHLSAALKKGGVKDLLDFFPVNKRNATELDAWFRKENMPEIADWYKKKHLAKVRENVINGLKELAEKDKDGDGDGGKEQMLGFIKDVQSETPIPETDLVGYIWTALMGSIDWGTRPDQVEGLALK